MSNMRLGTTPLIRESTLRPTARCIRYDRNRNIVTVLDGDDQRYVHCDRVETACKAAPEMVSRKFKGPNAYFGKTLERYLAEARMTEQPRATAQMVSGSTTAHQRLRSSMAVLGGGSGVAHVRATQLVSASQQTRGRSNEPRRKSGRTSKVRPCVHFDRSRNAIVLVDPSELPADHFCEHCVPRRMAHVVSCAGNGKSRRRVKSCSCVRFERNRNSIVLEDVRRCKQCEADVVAKRDMKFPATRIRAML